jgi:hypothetical protein
MIENEINLKKGSVKEVRETVVKMVPVEKPQLSVNIKRDYVVKAKGSTSGTEELSLFGYGRKTLNTVSYQEGPSIIQRCRAAYDAFLNPRLMGGVDNTERDNINIVIEDYNQAVEQYAATAGKEKLVEKTEKIISAGEASSTLEDLTIRSP